MTVKLQADVLQQWTDYRKPFIGLDKGIIGVGFALLRP